MRRFCGDEQCMEFCLWANYAMQTKADMVLAKEERKAAGGDADAARRLYTVFMQGLPDECVDVDKPRAMCWLRKAAELGDMDAQVAQTQSMRGVRRTQRAPVHTRPGCEQDVHAYAVLPGCCALSAVGAGGCCSRVLYLAGIARLIGN